MAVILVILAICCYEAVMIVVGHAEFSVMMVVVCVMIRVMGMSVASTVTVPVIAAAMRMTMSPTVLEDKNADQVDN